MDAAQTTPALNIGSAGHPSPLFGFIGNELVELGSGPDSLRGAQFGEAHLDLRIDKVCVNLFVERVNNRGNAVRCLSDLGKSRCSSSKRKSTSP
jgi:hypothetical protein